MGFRTVQKCAFVIKFPPLIFVTFQQNESFITFVFPKIDGTYALPIYQ